MKTIWSTRPSTPFADLVACIAAFAVLGLASPAPGDPAEFRAAALRAWEAARSTVYDTTLVAAHMTDDAQIELLDRAANADSYADLQRLLNEFLVPFGLSHMGVFSPADVEYYVLSTVGARDITQPRAFHMGCIYSRSPRGWIVRAVLEGYPGDRAGLRRGDLVITADGAPFRPIGSFDRGAPVQLQIRRGASTRWRVVTPVHESMHESLHQATARSARRVEVDGHRVGIVHLWACTSPVFLNDLRTAVLDSLTGCEGIVLDLRDGFGGWWFEYADVFFADRHDYPSIGAFGRRGSSDPKPPDEVAPHRIFAGPLVALVNDGTRSGKEGFAYHLKSRHRATLVGSTTAAAFNGMTASFLGPGRELLIETPVSRIVVDGHEIERIGVAPDVRVEDPIDRSSGGDPQLDMAIEVMRRTLSGH